MVVWITGLSGAGKTTLCTALHDLIKPTLPELVLLDGDVVRAAFGHNLGYAETDRVTQVRRLQAMAKVLAEQNLAVVVGVLYGNPDLLAWNRANLPNYFEVYLRASLSTVEARDTKLLYSKAHAGETDNVVGVDIPWHEPSAADLVFDADHPATPAEMALQLARAVPRFAAAIPAAMRSNRSGA